MQVIFLTRFVGISIEVIFYWRCVCACVLLVPYCGASLLLMSSKWRRHFWVAVIRHIIWCNRKLWVAIVILWLVMMVRLLWHHVMLWIGHLYRLSLITISVKVSVGRRMLWVCNELMVLMEGRELHWRSSRSSASERWRVREGQRRRFWFFRNFSTRRIKFSTLNNDDPVSKCF